MSREPDSPPDLPNLLHDTARAFGRWMDDLFTGTGVSPARARLVGVLDCSGPQTMAALAEALGVTPRNVTAIVDGLEADGLVARGSHPTDRRATVVELTAAGRKWAGQHLGPLAEAVAGAFADLPPTDRRELARLLEAVREAIRRRAGSRCG